MIGSRLSSPNPINLHTMAVVFFGSARQIADFGAGFFFFLHGSKNAIRLTARLALVFPAVLHGNNLLVFGGTGIPFGENNGNDVHVCNVKYKRWSLLNCRGKKPNRIYGQVKHSLISRVYNVSMLKTKNSA